MMSTVRFGAPHDRGRISADSTVRIREHTTGAKLPPSSLPQELDTLDPLTTANPSAVLYKARVQKVLAYIKDLAKKVDSVPHRTFLNKWLNGEQPELTTNEEIKLAAESMLRVMQHHDKGATTSHQYRVMGISSLIATKMKLEQKQRNVLQVASILHDVGKLDTPVGVLNKPGKLDEQERLLMQDHPVMGYFMLKKMPFPPWLKQAVLDVALRHHLRLTKDKKDFAGGYPVGQKMESITLPVAIVAVADSLDAAISPRPYKTIQPFRQILNESFYDNPQKRAEYSANVLKGLEEVSLKDLSKVMIKGRGLYDEPAAKKLINGMDPRCTIRDYRIVRLTEANPNVLRPNPQRTYDAFDTVYTMKYKPVASEPAVANKPPPRVDIKTSPGIASPGMETVSDLKALSGDTVIERRKLQ